MCQRRQKSMGEVARYGKSKFGRQHEAQQQRHADGDVRVAGEVAVDLTVNASAPVQASSALVAPEPWKSASAGPASMSATVFFKSPTAMSRYPRRTCSQRGDCICSNCGSSTEARMIGPATRCGKNDTAARNSSGRSRAGSSRRYTSIV